MEYERQTKEKTRDHDFILQGPYLETEMVIQWETIPAHHKEQLFKSFSWFLSGLISIYVHGGICSGEGL